MKVTINGYETLPAGRMWMNQVWSGDMLNAVISYLPEGTSGEVLSYWYQKAGGPVFNDCMCMGVDAAKPVMAHRFMNYLLDPEDALNELHRLRRLPAADHEDRRAGAVRAGDRCRANLRNCVVTREDYANGNAYLGADGRRPPRCGTSPGREFRNG